MKEASLVVFVLIFCCFSFSVSKADEYVFTQEKVFYSSDHGITIKFNIDPVGDSKLVPMDLGVAGGVISPTPVTLIVNGKHHVDGTVSIIDETWPLGNIKDVKRNRPHVLFSDFCEEDYAKIAGKKMAVVFYVYERPYPRDIVFPPMPQKK